MKTTTMKRSIAIPFGLACCLTFLLSPPGLAAGFPGQVDFGTFDPPEDGEFIEVRINSNLINMAARLTEKAEPDVARMLRNLKAVRVNVIGLTDENRDEITQRVQTVRRQLDEQGWERIVTVRDRNEDVGVYLKLRGEEAVEGLVVTVTDGQGEAVFVNIVGEIRPEQVAEIGERLHIEPLKQLGQVLNE